MGGGEGGHDKDGDSHAKVRLASRLMMVPKELEARHW